MLSQGTENKTKLVLALSRAGQSSRCMEMEIGALTLVERPEHLKPAQEKMGWLMITV